MIEPGDAKQNNKNSKRILEGSETSDIKRTQEITLRPQNLSEYVGQEEVKKNLNIAIKAAKKRKEPLEHILLHGPPGLGKTTLAHIISHEMNVNIKMTSGPALEKQGDLASLLTNLKDNDILFIDEMHRLRPAVEEVLYTAMEDFGIDIIIGQGPSARSVRLSIPPFTLIGATTKVSLLSSPLRDRFGNVFKLNFYSDKNIFEIIKRTASILKIEIDDEAAKEIAKAARQTPRIANRLLRRIRDVAEVNNEAKISKDIAKKGLASLGIDHLGLDQADRDILEFLITKFDGGPVGLNTISAATSEEQNTLEEVYEPYLLKIGLLERTPRGRVATKAAYDHLGHKSPHIF